jgi:invasion associated locus B (IalB) protein
MRKTLIAAAVAAALPFVLAASAGAQTVDLVEKQGVWSLYADTATPKAVCFIAAQPQAVEPLGANRGPIFFYITAWPKDGVRTEPSVKVGFPVKPDADMSVTVGTEAFKLFIKGERGFVADQNEELKLVDALKKGSTASVKATSARGTTTTDTYSLSGLKAALDKLAATCQ